MKIRVLKNAVLLVVLFAFFSCGKGGGYSRTTGWKYGDKSGSGFEIKKGKKTVAPPGMTYVPGGTFTMGEKTEFVTAPRNNNVRRKVSVSPFYMDKYEIRNVDWKEYTHWMEMVFGKAAPALVKRINPKNDVWRDELAYNEPFLDYYFTHPSYNEYPIVGISWEQAMDYCVWRTDRINELALINAGVLAYPDFTQLEASSHESVSEDFVFNTKKYLMQDAYSPVEGNRPKVDVNKFPRKANMNDGLLISNLRLPTEAEWEYAAYAIQEGKDGLVAEGKIYPWGGTQLRNHKGKHRGFKANFVRGRGDYMGSSKHLKSGNVITVPVDSYQPNDFGLYNMAGNVNEWVLDVYRSTTFDDVNEYNPFRGNVFTEAVPKDVEDMGNKNFQIDSLGRITTRILPDGDLRDYKDGDGFSRLGLIDDGTGGLASSSEELGEGEAEYPEGAAPFREETSLGEGTPLGDEQYLESKEGEIIDVTDVLAPKITNKTRVYKGGSWKDRAFWLNPSTRRYLDEDRAANDIGFRCAMSLVGGEGETNK